MDCASQATTVKLDPRARNRLHAQPELTMEKVEKKWKLIAQYVQQVPSVQSRAPRRLNARLGTTACMLQAPQSRVPLGRMVAQRDCGAWKTVLIATLVHSVMAWAYTHLGICVIQGSTAQLLPTDQTQSWMAQVARVQLVIIAR